MSFFATLSQDVRFATTDRKEIHGDLWVLPDQPQTAEHGFLSKASGYQFYNTSKYTFDKLIADPENIEANFRDYLAGFSGNVQDVLSKFDFDTVIRRMVESNTLYLTIKEFNSPKGYLGPDKISAVDCGYIFEDLVRRFSESFGEEAGAHFTSRDIIYLMTDLLLSDADLTHAGNVTVYEKKNCQL